MTKEQFLNAIGDFTWTFGKDFIIEVAGNYFIWADPDYNGDNSVREVSAHEVRNFFAEPKSRFMGRCKGSHVVKEYIGTEEITFVAL
jgi:hypothetical protein